MTFEPSGSYEPDLHGMWPQSVDVAVNGSVRCEALGFVADADIGHHRNALEKLVETWQRVGATLVEPGPASILFDGRIDEVVDELHHTLKGTREFGLPKGSTFVEGRTAAELEETLGKAYRSLRDASTSTKPDVKIKQIEESAKALRSVVPLQWSTTEMSTTLPRAHGLNLRSVRIPVSLAPRPHNWRDARLGTTTSLATLSIVLGALALRIPSRAAAGVAEDLGNSREALAAILLILPALLATQIDRPLSNELPGRATVAARVALALRCTLVLPVFGSVLLVGSLNPSTIHNVLLLTSAAAAFMALLSYGMSWGRVVRGSHVRLARKPVT